MFRYAAAAVLVLVPVLWGMLMVLVLDFFEKKIFLLTQKNNK
jgi:hypothetical protein